MNVLLPLWLGITGFSLFLVFRGYSRFRKLPIGLFILAVCACLGYAYYGATCTEYMCGLSQALADIAITSIILPVIWILAVIPKKKKP